MEEIISCCGVICSACRFFPADCPGCPAIEGKAFWLQFTGGDICAIYACCVQENDLPHCGKCGKLPCVKYVESEDPTLSKEENAEIFRQQVELLRSLD